MSQWLVNAWYRKSIGCYCLIPFSLIYRGIIKIRNWCYQSGIRKTIRLPVPVLVVGNITVGGTGKTPLVIYLANILREHGYKPGVITRGYGGKAKDYPCVATANSAPETVGDEAILLATYTNCPVVVDPNRVNAANFLLEKFNCDLIISDDGLQHYVLDRAIEIAVVDGERRFGNNFCLPAGPLREPISRLKKVNFIIANGKAEAGEFAMQLLPGAIYNLKHSAQTLAHNNVTNQTVHAVAGIGNPKRFFNLLRELKFTVIEHPFPDHYVYQEQDLNFNDSYPIIMTEKDAVKCRKFVNEKIWCLPVQAEVENRFLAALLDQLVSAAKA